jgi:hypothetical protein
MLCTDYNSPAEALLESIDNRLAPTDRMEWGFNEKSLRTQRLDEILEAAWQSGMMIFLAKSPYEALGQFFCHYRIFVSLFSGFWICLRKYSIIASRFANPRLSPVRESSNEARQTS